jgi:UDP-2-acetamido-3-amino-2,3-dideoxy-glucuronate N-acetyltransferase
MDGGQTVAVTIHPTAEVEPGAIVGDGSRIWHFAHVRAGARVGRGCVVGRAVFIDAGVVVGDACKVQNNALLYAPAVIGRGVFIGPGVILTNDRTPRAVNHDFSPKDASDWTHAGVVVEDGASIGAGTVVVAGITIGRWSMVAAGAVVAGPVAAFALVAGVPARRIGWVGPAGARLVEDGGGFRCPSTGARFVEIDRQLEVAP